ncbi:MAG TPA: tetratricopeptide repeat protein [Thermoanaerobaculia bacterium]
MKIHPNDFSLEEFLLSLSREHLVIVEHLSRCATCRRRFVGFTRHRSGVLARKVADVLHWRETPDYGQVLREHEESFREREQCMAKERLEALGLFVELTGHPAEQRDLVLRNSPRFQTWGVFELLVERCLETSIQSPLYAEELGKLALQLSDLLDTSQYGAEVICDLRARALAYVGNARRIRSELQEAEEAFQKAYVELQKGTHDPLERAILLDLEASLRRAQRRFDEAYRLLRRAISIFLQTEQRHRAGRSLVNLATVLHVAGNLPEAIPLLYQALELIDSEQEPRLLLCTKHNLIDDLAELGRFLEAQKLYRDTRALYRNFPDAWTQNRRKWVKGKIARGLGQADQAESLFLAAREGFINEGIPYDTALVSLELATLYSEQRRTADLKRLAEEMVPIFSSLYIHREALAALAYLKQAAEAERATMDLVTGVAVYLRRAQHDPSLRFSAPE